MDEHNGADQGLRIVSYLIAGLVFYGGLGWLLDRWFNTAFCLPAGIILGSAASIYVIIKRFGRP